MRKKLKFGGVMGAMLIMAANLCLPVYADDVHSQNVDNIGSYENREEIVKDSGFELSDGNSEVVVTAELGTTYFVVLPNKIHLQHKDGSNWSANYKVKAKGNILDSQYIEIKPSTNTFNLVGTDTSKNIEVTTTQAVTKIRNAAKKTDSDALLDPGSDNYTELLGKMDTQIQYSDRYSGTTSFDYALKNDG